MRKEYWLTLCLALVLFATAALLLKPVIDGPGDPPCYFVVDREGREYPSYYPPYPAADGPSIWVFNDDHRWGYVFGPNAVVADRDCLRERGVDVPPLRVGEEGVGD
jgi:hypothetical protein